MFRLIVKCLVTTDAPVNPVTISESLGLIMNNVGSPPAVYAASCASSSFASVRGSARLPASMVLPAWINCDAGPSHVQRTVLLPSLPLS